MKLLEYEGKALFRSHGITTPKFVLFSKSNDEVAIVYPVILKSQVPSGDRMAKGGIVIVPKAADLDIAIKKLFITRIDGNLPEYLLAEEFILNAEELYVSFSYSSEKRDLQLLEP